MIPELLSMASGHSASVACEGSTSYVDNAIVTLTALDSDLEAGNLLSSEGSRSWLLQVFR